MEFRYQEGNSSTAVTVSSVEANSFKVSFVDRTDEGISWRSIHRHMLGNDLYAKVGLPESATTNWECSNDRTDENLRTITVRFVHRPN
jgi:hypothetical protein